MKDSLGVKNPYRYRGYRYDTETGLYYLQSRYYNPEWGRFINGDSVLGATGQLLTHNMFTYSLNNPVNMYDSDGRFAITLAFVAVKAIFVIAAALTTVYAYHTVVKPLVSKSTTTLPMPTFKTKSKTQVKTKTKTKIVAIPITKTEKKKSDYFVAVRKKGGGIDIREPLNLNQAQERVLSGGDVYAVSQLHAVFLAGTLGGMDGSPDKPDIHDWHPENKYHYHLKGRVGGHIFFDK